MKTHHQPVLILSAAFLLAFSSLAVADVAIQLKDGRTVTVPVSREDVVSITFTDAAAQVPDFTLDFETGDLRGWEKAGDAFDTQPTYGDNPTARCRGQPSNHQGSYWIGGYENCMNPSDPSGRIQGDGPQGTLTSRPFVIRGSTISFLVGGGCDMNTERIELLVDGEVVLQTTGKCTETMERVAWDVAPFKGRTAQIRIIDSSGGGWGHINVDDIRLE